MLASETIFHHASPSFLLNSSRAADATTISVAKMFDFLQMQHRLMLDDPELANALVLVNDGIPCGISEEVPFVTVTLVRFIDDADAVCRQNAKLLERAASPCNKSFLTFRLF